MPGGARRGARQHRALASTADPDQMVELKVRVPSRLRSKVHAAAAALDMSASAYLEQLVDQAPMPEPLQEPLPLAETA